MPSDLPLDCRKILSRWSACEFYCYMRPVTSKLINAAEKHTVYWVVSVEYRVMPPGMWRAEGYSLAEVIRELDQSVPKRRGEHRINQRDHPGLNAPEKAQKRAQQRRKATREDVARHRRIAESAPKKKRKKVRK